MPTERYEAGAPSLRGGGAAAKLIAGGVVLVICMVLTFLTVEFHTVGGNEIGVKETFSSGVQPDPYPSRTYMLWRFWEEIYNYPLSLQVFVMNDRTHEQGETGEGRQSDAYLVQSKDSQDMHISLNVQWRLDSAHIVEIHKHVRSAISEKLLRPVVMRVVKDQATTRTAMEAYSGSGLVTLQNDIYQALANRDGELFQTGIIVENFVIEHIQLDPKYVSEITERQVAIQKTLKEQELRKAAEATALRVQADAQADYNKQVVEAQRDKEVGILSAEKTARQQILAAEAEKQKQVLLATGGRDASLLQAEGTLAKGKAEAEAQKLMLSAYAVPGAGDFVRIKVSENFAKSTAGLQGYLPSEMNVFTLGENYMKAVERVVGK